MSTTASLASLAALIGEPARTAMLIALFDGRALTAGELARVAGVGASGASGHLAQLLDGGLLALERQGRHRYFRLASPAVAATIEGLMALDATREGGVPRRAVVTGPRDAALRRARLCYDHLAGAVAVAIADAMIARGELDFSADGAMLREAGRARLEGVGVDLSGAGRSRPFCRPCLDWSERRPHLAGTVGAALFAMFVDRGWMRRSGAGRAMIVTPLGLAGLADAFDVRV